ncbi:MAG: ABC transporter permease, partial [Candidatus Nanohaloarchaea archaeon]
MRRIAELLKMYVLDKLRSPVIVAISLLWAFAFFVFLYFVFERGGLSFGGGEFGPKFIASYLVLIPAYISIFGTLGGIIGDREKGVLKAYRSSRLTKTEYFTARILVSLLSSLVIVLMLLGLSMVLAGLSLSLLLLVPLVVMTVISHAGIAFVTASLSEDSSESRMVAQTFMLALIAGTPVFYPAGMLPL